MLDQKTRKLANRVVVLENLIHPIFNGEDPGVIGGTIAELMAIWLMGHRVDDVGENERLREDLLQQWCDAVRELVAMHEKRFSSMTVQ